MTCDHKNFQANFNVSHGPDERGKRRYMAAAKVQCVDCGQPFRFLGLPGAMNLYRPNSLDNGRTAFLPIAPEGEGPSLSELILTGRN